MTFPLCLADRLVLALVLLERPLGYNGTEPVAIFSIEFIIKTRWRPLITLRFIEALLGPRECGLKCAALNSAHLRASGVHTSILRPWAKFLAV